ncbi:MAG: hypothetical protein KatS3mg019_0696 [Fimbriimonadales bacterium]|nr:MAG: hypothetical protein KatS3mg019_0696 [Fimbriimonadales bacterium]
MKKHCKELERYLASGVETLPDTLRTHLAQCEPCQRAWQLEQGYQRALQAARSEPTPACDIPWSSLQAKLAERAVTRPRPMFGRFAPAFGVGAMALIALGWLLSTHAPQPLVALNAEPTTGVAESLSQTPSVKTVSAAPIFSDRTRNATPATPPMREPVRPPAPITIRATEKPSTTASTMGQSSGTKGIATSDHDATPHYQVAALPLSQFRVGDGAEVDYLPFNYGNSPSEGVNEHAMVGSF